jgi:hypothetical protein
MTITEYASIFYPNQTPNKAALKRWLPDVRYMWRSGGVGEVWPREAVGNITFFQI